MPYAHCSMSRLVCSIAEQLMDDVNIHMMLPNRFVYGLHVSITHPQSPYSHLTFHPSYLTSYMSVSITSLISSLSL